MWQECDLPHLAYPKGIATDLIITYLSHPSKSGFVVEPLVVRREAVGKKLSLRRCAKYLHNRFPHKTFSHEHVLRCYHIFWLAAHKATHIDAWYDNCTDVCYETFYTEHGVLRTKRRTELKYMFKAQELSLVCYDIHQQLADEWTSFSDSELDERRRCPYPQFTLIELLEHDWAYDIFRRFWEPIPSHEDVRALLQPSLSRDTVDHIFSMLWSTRFRNLFLDHVDDDDVIRLLQQDDE